MILSLVHTSVQVLPPLRIRVHTALLECLLLPVDQVTDLFDNLLVVVLVALDLI